MRNTAAILLVVVFGLGLSASAETAVTEAGIRFGLGSYTVKGEGVDWFESYLANTPTDHRMGYRLGGFLKIQLNERLALQPELLYATKGAKWEAGADELTGKLEYIELPVMLKVGLAPRTALAPEIYGGPSIGLLTSSGVVLHSTWYDGSYSLTDETQKFALNAVFGLSTRIRTGVRGALIFDIRGELGLTDVNALEGLESYFAGQEYLGGLRGSVKTQGFGLLVGYSFL